MKAPWMMVLGVGLSLASRQLDAQRTAATARASKPSTSCSIDSGAKWIKRQRTWLDESRHEWTNDSLRQVLIAAVGSDTSVLGRVQLGAELLTNGGVPLGVSQDTVIASLKSLARQRGSAWPTRSVVGARGVRALWMLALRDTALQRTILHRLMEAGPDESFPPDVATLEDRLRARDGRKQLYGTQLDSNRKPTEPSGALEPLPIEDAAHVDLRREGALLPPWQLSGCLAAKSSARDGR